VRRGCVELPLVLSPDGENLYLGSCEDLTVFSRNSATGGLRELPSPNGCIDASGPV
jgi:hypothetical protein